MCIILSPLQRRLVLSVLLGATFLIAQEPNANTTTPAGARSQRGPRSDIREFLGLGPAPDPAAAKKGEPLFKQNCGGCHGDNARGAQGPNLVRSLVVLHDEKDEEIGSVIKSGRPQGGMPAFPQLSQEDIHDISQFIKLQVELAANRGTYNQAYGKLKNQPVGDPQKGQEFFAANCAGCHSASGDLAKIGAKFPEASLMQARFLWPASRGPVQATVVTGSGEKISGTLSEI